VVYETPALDSIASKQRPCPTWGVSTWMLEWLSDGACCWTGTSTLLDKKREAATVAASLGAAQVTRAKPGTTYVYQLPFGGQAPLPTGVQVRVTIPLASRAMLNLSFVVTDSAVTSNSVAVFFGTDGTLVV
jgi:hypothetical protein